jgi:hypothetical protein
VTTDLFDVPYLVRAQVRRDDQVHTAQVAISGGEWADAPITARKFAIGKAKSMLFLKGLLCLQCGESVEACPMVPCPVCPHVRVRLWDDRAEYPITDDMLRVYVPTTRFNAIATVDEPRTRYTGATTAVYYGRATRYTAQEFRGTDWTEMPMEERQRVMQGLVDELLRFYPDTDRARVRTLINDGKREMPYPANWLAVHSDQAG